MVVRRRRPRSVWFTVSRDGAAILSNSLTTSGSFSGLQPETTNTFSVEARDSAGFRVQSDPLTVTTAARINDVTPPTAPAVPEFSAQDGETWLRWPLSADDITPQDLIVYCIYVNDVLDNCQTYPRAIV